MASSKSFGTKKPVHQHLVAGSGGLSGEITDLREDVEGAFKSIEDLNAATGTNPLCVQEWIDPVAANTAGLEAATATQTSPRTVTTFLSGGVAALAAAPRNITFTTGGTTPSDAPATATITGTDINGAALTETVNLSQVAGTAAGVKAFKTVTSIAYVAGDGTNATVSIGFGSVFGLAKKAKVRAGGVGVVTELVDGSRVTTGAFTSPTDSPPNGTYTPATAPNDAHDYAVYYEKDMS